MRGGSMDRQNRAFRDPIDVMLGSQGEGVTAKSLRYKATDGFVETLQKHDITLFVTREYEHFVVALTFEQGSLVQSYVVLPHPSGLVVNRRRHVVYIAATRNPNQIWEFRPSSNFLERIEVQVTSRPDRFLLPSRVKYYPGAYYLHELALINGDLFANSVGQNGIIRVDMGSGKSDPVVWWPKCIEDEHGKPDFRANYLQLNSIAAGRTLEDSFFSASSSKISSRRPGHLNYPVDKKGVIFSGKTREVIATGLTRPHSARLDGGKIWVDNSGYGEVGYIEGGAFQSIRKLPGWTRGLRIIGDVLFVGVSRVLPRFRNYAPGLRSTDQVCGVYAIEKKTARILGSIVWPHGNQIFALDYLSNTIASGFVFAKAQKTTKNQANIFYSYMV